MKVFFFIFIPMLSFSFKLSKKLNSLTNPIYENSEIIKIMNTEMEIIKTQDGLLYLKRKTKEGKEVFINLNEYNPQIKKTDNKKEKNIENLIDFTKIPIPILEWNKIPSLNDKIQEREGHSIVTFDENLIIFGGCKTDDVCFNDISFFNLK